MQEVQSFLIRIFNNIEIPVGCGFLIGDSKQHIVTCCHVVNEALVRKERSKPDPDTQIILDFPFLTINKRIKAYVLGWNYDDTNVFYDIAILKLLQSPPYNSKPAPIIDYEDYSGDQFRAFGFPNGFEANGREVKGILGTRQVNRHILAEGISEFGYFFEGGFSGTPIWNNTESGVCGMAFQLDTPTIVKVASIIPTDLLIKAAPNIIYANLHVNADQKFGSYLHKLIRDLEQRRGVLQYEHLSGSTTKNSLTLEDEFGFSELVTDNSKNKTTIPLGKIHDALKIHSKFILVGDAGSSKTTTIRRLALEAARRRLIHVDAPLPLILHLPRWQSETSVEEFIRNQWEFRHLPLDIDPILLIQKEQVILYLDGLNEIGHKASNIVKIIEKWLLSIGEFAHVIVTCRKNIIRYLDLDSSIPVVQINLMSEKQIINFTKKYLSDDSEIFLNQVFSSTNETTQNMRHLRHLASNPYMLSALIYTYDESSSKQLPKNYGVLFQRLTKALARREVNRSSPGWSSFNGVFPRIEESLAKLAFAMIDQDKGTEVERSFVKEFIDDHTLQMARNANYIEVEESKIRFYHQLMQEYFASVVLKGFFENHDGIDYTKLARQFSDTKWDYPIISALGTSQKKDMALNFILRYKPLLASKLPMNGIDLTQDYIDSICIQLFDQCIREWEFALDTLERFKQSNFYEETYSFDQMASNTEDAIAAFNQRAIRILSEYLDHQYTPISQIAIRSLKLIGHVDALPHLISHSGDHRTTPWSEKLSDEIDSAIQAIRARQNKE